MATEASIPPRTPPDSSITGRVLAGWYRFTLACTSEVRLGAVPGSTLRGALAGALRPLVCVTQMPTCNGCLLRSTCAYGFVFETAREPAPGGQTGFEDTPRPFVLHFPEPPRAAYEAGDAVRFDVVLLGKAPAYLPHLVYAVRSLEETGLGAGRRAGHGRFRLAAVEAVGPEGNTPLLDEDVLCQPPPSQSLETLVGWKPTTTASRHELCLETPLRLMHGGQWVRDRAFELHHLVRVLARRLDLLARFHGAHAPAVDVEALVAASETVRLSERRLRWRRQERYSHRQRQTMPMDGLLGRVVCEGVPPELVPVLAAGQLIHAGKGATMGMGQYAVRPLS